MIILLEQTEQLSDIHPFFSYMLYKNFQNNLVLQLDSNWTIQSVKVDSTEDGTSQTKLLEEKEDYNVEIKEPNSVLTLHDSQSLYIQKLVVNLVDENDKTEQILIKGDSLLRTFIDVFLQFFRSVH